MITQLNDPENGIIIEVTARDLLAKDIRDLRNYTNAPNSAIKELIDLNKSMYPNAYKK